MTLQEKYENLKQYLHSLKSIAVAFSGGVDSTFLLKTAHDVLGDKVIAVTAHSYLNPKREIDASHNFCKTQGITQIIFDSNELHNAEFIKNSPNRCYICKKSIFNSMVEIAHSHGIDCVVEGSNIDDITDFRPGQKAISELNIKSPLKIVALDKSEIRILSKDLNLPTWDKQSFACLATRFPYGEKITKQGLNMIDLAEEFLLGLGIKQVRVRIHGNLARIETSDEGFNLIQANRKLIHEKFKSIGFTYISLDLLGYRTGSMNETLSMDITSDN